MKGKLRVLICEDDFLVSQGLKRFVESMGHEVIAIANNGKEGVDLAVKNIPDLIIMDINMPVMSGLIAIEEINQTLNIPCIILTAYYKESLIKKASENGALYYIIKPVSEQELNAAINIVMARFSDMKKLRDELDKTKEQLESRKYIEIAKGLLQDKLNISESDAMQRLQKLSRDRNIKLVDLSKRVIDMYKK